jgi:hypothetical protein
MPKRSQSWWVQAIEAERRNRDSPAGRIHFLTILDPNSSTTKEGWKFINSFLWAVNPETQRTMASAVWFKTLYPTISEISTDLIRENHWRLQEWFHGITVCSNPQYPISNYKIELSPPYQDKVGWSVPRFIIPAEAGTAITSPIPTRAPDEPSSG